MLAPRQALGTRQHQPLSRAAGRETCKRACRRAALLVRADAAAQSKPLVVVGSLNADQTIEVPRLPKAGETIIADSLSIFPGGKGANQAAAAAKLSQRTLMIGQLGRDANAQLLRDSLIELGADLTHIREVDGPTGSAVILLQPSGENSILVVGGANQAEWKLPDAAREALKQAGALLLQREVPEHVNTEAAQIAAQHGVTVVMDCGGEEGPISPELLQHVTYLSPNETELARLTGLPTGSDEEIEAAVAQIKEQGVSQVLVKLGGAGSVLYGADGSVTRQSIFKVDRVVDTTGAGDTFTAAFAVALLEGLPAQQALAFASAAGAVCVQRPGAMPSAPTRGEVEAILQR